MLFDHFFQLVDFKLRSYSFNIYHLLINILIKITVQIQYISDTAAHSGCKVLSSLAKNNNASSGHVLASMITNTFYNCFCARVSDCKTLTCHTIDKSFTTGCSVKCNISYYNILFVFKCNTLRWIHDQFSAWETFTKIIIAVSYKFQCQTLWNKCTKWLTTCSGTFDHITIFLYAFRISSCNFWSENCSKCTVGVRDIDFQASLLMLFKCRKQFFYKDSFVQRLLQFEIINLLWIISHWCLCSLIRVLQDLA